MGDILLQKNYIHPHELIKIVCLQIGIPYQVEIKVEEIDPNVVKDLSINYAKHHEVLPCLETDFSVTVLMSNPFNFNVVNDLHMIFKKEIKIVCTTPLRIQDAINRVYEKAIEISWIPSKMKSSKRTWIWKDRSIFSMLPPMKPCYSLRELGYLSRC